MARDMRRSISKMPHEQRAVRSVLGHADRPLRPPAAAEAGTVVAQEQVVIRERDGSSTAAKPRLRTDPNGSGHRTKPRARSSYSQLVPSTVARSISLMPL